MAAAPSVTAGSGVNSIVIATETASADGQDSIAIGNDSKSSNDQTVAVGDTSEASGRKAVAIGYKASATDDHAVAVGSMAAASSTRTTAVGLLSQASGARSTALGSQAHADVEQGVAIGYASVSDRAGNSSNGYDPVTNASSTSSNMTWKGTYGAASVGNSGETRQITYVAAGEKDTDAVNVAQLKKLRTYATYQEGDGVTITDNSDGSHQISVAKGTMDQINTNTSDIASNKDSIDKNTKDIAANKDNIDKNTKDIASNKDSIDKNTKDIATNKDNISKNAADISVNKDNIAQNARDIRGLNREVRQVGAGAAALAGLHPVDFDPDSKWNVAVSGGSYKDQQALALGAFYHPNDDTLFSVGSTLGNDDNMVTVGASFKLGSKGNIEKINPSQAAKEITSLKKEVAELKAENKEQSETLAAQQKQLARQEILIQKLMAKTGVTE